jgi:tetraacyldisaccharide 4'-kinase
MTPSGKVRDRRRPDDARPGVLARATGGGLLPLLLSPVAAVYAAAHRAADAAAGLAGAGAGDLLRQRHRGRLRQDHGGARHRPALGQPRHRGALPPARLRRHERGPLRVDPAVHDSTAVGDEALLLAAERPAWISADRAAGARAAVAAGAQAIVMDDGLQNPTLEKDLSLLIVDGATASGTGASSPPGRCASRWAPPPRARAPR